MRTVLVARDDHAGWVAARRALAGLPDVRLVGDATTQALALAVRHRPDVVVCGIEVEGVSALPLLAGIREALPACTLLVVGDAFECLELSRFLGLRVGAFLSWRDLSAPLLADCVGVGLGGTVAAVSRDVLAALLAEAAGARAQRAADSRTLDRLSAELTEQERKLWPLLAAGLRTREIARDLAIAERTVEHHATQLYATLGVRGRTQAAAFYFRLHSPRPVPPPAAPHHAGGDGADPRQHRE